MKSWVATPMSIARLLLPLPFRCVGGCGRLPLIAMAKQRGDVVGLDERAPTAAATGSVVDVEQGSAGRCGERPQLRDSKRRQAGRRPAADVRCRSHGERERKQTPLSPLRLVVRELLAASQQLAHVVSSTAESRQMQSCVKCRPTPRLQCKVQETHNVMDGSGRVKTSLLLPSEKCRPKVHPS